MIALSIVFLSLRVHVGTSWSQYRNMTVQLLSMAIIYIFDLPYVIVTIVRWSGSPKFGSDLQEPYF